MTTSRLDVYNIALTAIGERTLDSLNEDGEPRRVCDHVWSRAGGMIRALLNEGYWNFAMRAVKWDASQTVTPAFGWAYAFELPSDYVKLDMISGAERFNMPLKNYEVEANFIFCDFDPLYVRYVSDDMDYGGDVANWTECFTLWAGYYMAVQINRRLKNASIEDHKALMEIENRYRTEARSNDAQEGPTRRPPMGEWVSSRRPQWWMRRDWGSRSQLIG